MIETFFRHKCNIYPVSYEEVTGKYGLPTSDKVAVYEDEPSSKDLMCFFDRGFASSPVVIHQESISTYDGANELSIPYGTNIKRGDKVVDTRYGHEYIAGFPEKIRGKYIVVPLQKVAKQEWL